MADEPVTEESTVEETPQTEEVGPDGKVLRKTFEEIREESRRAILSQMDRDKLEELEPAEREFVEKVCLFEAKSQKISRRQHKVKLREIMLCRDIAQAYCPGRDALGQYSEGKRILANSETGGDSVKFVLARKVCGMLDKINTIYTSNAASFVRGDLHRLETELLNYINRLGRMIKEPLGEARRIYGKLRERAGWNLPVTAFNMAEDCDVPLIFFNRYSSPSQLLLKDPQKPFRSDTVSPPLKLDFRIKNAVLIVAGENRFHLDHKRFDKVKDSSAARQIMQASLHEGKNNIAEQYKKNTLNLTEGFSPTDDINIQSIKENAFGFFFMYTLKNLPSTASRADAVELFILELMRQENDLGCKGFCRYLYSPSAVDDPPESGAWNTATTRALELRRVFDDLSNGKIRLSIFPTRLNQLLTAHLGRQLETMRNKVGAPYKARIAQAEGALKDFNRHYGSPLDSLVEAEAALERKEADLGQVTEASFALVAELLKKDLVARNPKEKRDLLLRVKPSLEGKAAELREFLEKLRKGFENLNERKKKLGDWLVQAMNLTRPSGAGADPGEHARKLAELVAALNQGEAEAFSGEAAALSTEISTRRVKVIAAQERIKAQFDQARGFTERLKSALAKIGESETLAKEIEALRLGLEESTPLREKEALLREALSRISLEYEEKVGGIEEAMEVNKET